MVMKFPPWGEEPIFEWDEANEDYIWAHRVTIFEVYECFDNGPLIAPHQKANSNPSKYGDRYIVLSSTNGGRKLMVIVQHKGSNLVRPITAMEVAA